MLLVSTVLGRAAVMVLAQIPLNQPTLKDELSHHRWMYSSEYTMTFDGHGLCRAARCCTPDTRQGHATVCWSLGRRDSHSSFTQQTSVPSVLGWALGLQMLREHMQGGGRKEKKYVCTHM